MRLPCFVPWPEYGHLWWTWWLGDYAGILCITPVLLVLGLHKLGRSVAEPVLFPLCTLWFGLSLIAFFVVSNLEMREQKARQQHQLQQAVSALEKGLEETVSIVTAFRAFYDSSNFVDEQEFHSFAQTLMASHHDVLALEWAPYIAQTERATFEASMRASGWLDWQIIEPAADGSLKRATERAEYFPLVYLFPLNLNAGIAGLDIGYETERRASLALAVEKDRVVVSPPIRLNQLTAAEMHEEDRIGALVLAPVFGKTRPSATAAQRRDNLSGYVIAALRLASLRHYIELSAPGVDYGFQLFDTSAGTHALLLQSRKGAAPLSPTELKNYLSAELKGVGGRRWTLVALDSGSASVEQWRAWWLLLFGFSLSAIITWYIDLRRQADARLRANERYASQLFKSTPDALLVVNREGQIVRANAQAVSLFGYSAQTLSTMPIDNLLPPAQRNLHATMRQEFFQTSLNRTMALARPLTALRADGQELPVEISLNPVLLPSHDGAPEPAVIAAVRDVSARRAAEAAIVALNASLEVRVEERTKALAEEVAGHERTEKGLFEANQQLLEAQALMQRSNDELELRNREAGLLRELTGFIESCADVAEALQSTGHYLPYLFPLCDGCLYYQAPAAGELLQVAQWRRQADGTTEAGTTAMPAQIAEDSCWGLRRSRLYLVNTDSAVHCAHIVPADYEPFDYLCAPLVAHGQQIGLLHLRSPKSARGSAGSLPMALAASAAEQIAMMLNNLLLRETLRDQTLRDPLTRLFNRRYFVEIFKQELARASRSHAGSGQHRSSLVMIDLDHFKRCNDQYGHEAGDYLLQTFADTLRAHLRESDVLCRLGGEEFVVVLPDSGPEQALQCMRNLAGHWRATALHYDGQAIPAQTFSAGIACYPTPFNQTESLLKAADAAMYRAKSAGRDRIELA